MIEKNYSKPQKIMKSNRASMRRADITLLCPEMNFQMQTKLFLEWKETGEQAAGFFIDPKISIYA